MCALVNCGSPFDFVCHVDGCGSPELIVCEFSGQPTKRLDAPFPAKELLEFCYSSLMRDPTMKAFHGSIEDLKTLVLKSIRQMDDEAKAEVRRELDRKLPTGNTPQSDWIN